MKPFYDSDYWQKDPRGKDLLALRIFNAFMVDCGGATIPGFFTTNGGDNDKPGFGYIAEWHGENHKRTRPDGTDYSVSFNDLEIEVTHESLYVASIKVTGDPDGEIEDWEYVTEFSFTMGIGYWGTYYDGPQDAGWSDLQAATDAARLWFFNAASTNPKIGSSVERELGLVSFHE